MVGVQPRTDSRERAGWVNAPGLRRRARAFDGRWIAAAILSLSLAHCGKAPEPGMLAANTHATSGDTFEDRFPQPQFRDRFPTAQESLTPLQRTAAVAPAQAPAAAPGQQTAQRAAPSPVRLASISPTLTLPRQTERDELTTLVSMKSSAFPYFGNNPRTDAPFLNVGDGSKRGHRSYGGRVFWQNETYNDNRVLVHVPEAFDVNKPGVIVVFFHGNGATLERDVRDRQLVPQQITESGVNAVLLAPQMAVDAADSSAGKFWQPGGLKRFLDESASHLARLYGDPKAAQAFANMPVVIVGYSGGFLPTAWSLEVGGATSRVRGVLLLDAVYGELDKFASWIEKNRTGFFVSSYTRYTKPRDRELMSMLRDKGIAVSESMEGPLRPGSVVFVQTRDGITHRSYVTQAWTQYPIKEVLTKMAASAGVSRVASATGSASR